MYICIKTDQIFLVCFVVLDSQLCAAFDAAALDDGTSGFCRDTCAEAMRAGTVAGVWLVRSFWHIFPSLAVGYVFGKNSEA